MVDILVRIFPKIIPGNIRVLVGKADNKQESVPIKAYFPSGSCSFLPVVFRSAKEFPANLLLWCKRYRDKQSF
jgi:hypothetical protein